MCLGIPGQVVEITDAERQLANISVGGVVREVSLACVVNDYFPAEACVGQWVLVHVGFAMSVIDEKQANETLRTLEELGEMQEELEAMQHSGQS